jgi:ADP-heptose:LPS heptosyltransferase
LLEQARLLEPLGIESTNPRYALDATPLAASRAEVARHLPEQFVALHPFASSRDRCVPLGEWTQVAFALAARRMPVLWIGTTPDLDALRAMTLPRGFYIDQIGDASLTITAAALSLAPLFAGHDSGPLHVAGAFGVPVVGVFAPGEPDRTFPQGVGRSRMIARPSPAGISAADILRELDGLQVLSEK